MRYGLNPLVGMVCLLALPSCNDGSVSVVQSDGSPTPSKGISQGLTAGGSGTAPAQTSSSPTLFFSVFGMSQTGLGGAAGIGFLPADSQVSDAFELSFPCASSGCVFFPSATGFALALPEKFGETLEVFRLSDLQPTTLFQSQAPIVAMAGDPAGAWTAFANGSASLTIRVNGRSSSISLAQSGSVSALSAAAGDLLLVTLGGSSTLYQLSFSGQSASVTVLKTVPSAQVAVNPSGNQLSWISVKQDGSADVNLWDRKTGNSQSLGVASGSLSDLAMASPNTVVFRETTSSADAIEQADFTSASVSSVIDLAPGAPAAGSVCPVVVNGAVYYADRNGSSFSIFHASLGPGGAWTSAPFAIPDADDGMAYLCPKVWQGSSP